MITVPRSLVPKPSAAYPPVVFRTELEKLIESHPQKPTVEELANALGVTRQTMYKYLKGGSIPLLHALQLAGVLSTGREEILKVEDIWSVR